eukprot:scaffold1467_cov264-Pinguiococcus_pyrenoidosus.AAC.13
MAPRSSARLSLGSWTSATTTSAQPDARAERAVTMPMGPAPRTYHDVAWSRMSASRAWPGASTSPAQYHRACKRP